jgi:hypothetical protein
MAEVVGQAGGVHQVGVAPQRRAQLTADLRALQRVGQAGARDRARPVGARAAGLDHLGLAGQPPERAGVQHARPVAGEGPAPEPLGSSGSSRARSASE